MLKLINNENICPAFPQRAELRVWVDLETPKSNFPLTISEYLKNLYWRNLLSVLEPFKQSCPVGVISHDCEIIFI